ncbi:UNVERIFIED_CONTAM: hypothetical protein Sangu_1703100 [Sesamum angustifolium]|uniref:CCHC-type domain-containing protein n=1 Tax=Sesamum angustifolium TaxID=2727405 RepID=A0AAW2MKK2_9LAMI
MSLTSRALDGRPWSFEKNILILNAIGENENLMQVDLEKCDFFVHMHDLPLNMVNLGVATLIENRIRIFWDMEVDDSGCSWGASLRIRVGLNANQPLKRDLKIWSTSGGRASRSIHVQTSSNFCFLCGCLGHIDKYCGVRFEVGFQDMGEATPYCLWPRVPVPVKGQHHILSRGEELSSASFSLKHPPVSMGLAVFGNFTKA